MKKIERIDITRSTAREVNKMITPLYEMLVAFELKHGVDLVEERFELIFGTSISMKKALCNARLRSF